VLQLFYLGFENLSLMGATVKTFADLDAFAAAAGSDLGTTDWLVVDQERINQFAAATDDHQWIHVDPERAASGPFGGTIAHGLLTLSLLPVFMHQLYEVHGVKMAINYGLNKVRFMSPVPAGSKLRASAQLVEVTEVAGGAQGIVSTTIEIEGVSKPACVIESIVRFVA
jgi:acyl dehydratase